MSTNPPASSAGNDLNHQRCDSRHMMGKTGRLLVVFLLLFSAASTFLFCLPPCPPSLGLLWGSMARSAGGLSFPCFTQWVYPAPIYFRNIKLCGFILLEIEKHCKWKHNCLEMVFLFVCFCCSCCFWCVCVLLLPVLLYLNWATNKADKCFSWAIWHFVTWILC